MNIYIYIIGVLLSTWTLPVFSQVSNDNEDEVNKVDTRWAKNDYVPGQVLVKFKDANRVQIRRSHGQFASTNVGQVTSVLQKFGVSDMEQLLPNEKPNRQLRRAKAYNGDIIQEHDLSQLYCVKLSAEHQHETMQIVDELKGLEEVEFAEPNYRVYMMADTHIADDYSGNSMESQQWYLDAYGVKELWNKPIINKERPVIAILDTGVDLTHPDLKDNLWTNTVEEYGTKDNDNDGNGFKNDVHGWDFVNNTANIRDNNMHGTHVAGIAAAANNGIGIIGANPQALIMPITVLQSDGAGDMATIIKGISYAISNGATVLNMSFGFYTNSKILRQALESAYQKAVLIAAAGNDKKCIYSSHAGIDELHTNEPTACFPAAYSFVLGVQACTSSGYIAPFSNFDDDGVTFSCESTLSDPDGFNYEIIAPGKNMLSTIPGGNYKELNGTSMAAPLVAGAISALKMVKQYDTQEILWGDLLHTNTIAAAYELTKRPAELEVLRTLIRKSNDMITETGIDYEGSHEIDAGETIYLYPVIRTTFGDASNIKTKLEMGDEFEDQDVVDIIVDHADFGMHLDAGGKGISKNPLVMKISKNVADSRHIKMKVILTCDESNISYECLMTFVVSNTIKLNGLLTENMTLKADHVYYVNGNLGINNNVTLTIEPGTRLEFANNTELKAFGTLRAHGTPEKPIVFTNHAGSSSWVGLKSSGHTDTISYCRIENASYRNAYGDYYMEDCIIEWDGGVIPNSIIPRYGVRNLIYGINMKNYGTFIDVDTGLKHTNIVNNDFGISANHLPKYSELNENNYLNNFAISNEKLYSLSMSSNTPKTDYSLYPSYLGTGEENVIRPYIYELGNATNTWGSIYLGNIRKEPVREAHGIIWKVIVNGKDAQDEFNELAPLGVGKHKFEVYFNRPMNKSVIPQISFGVRDPWTQQMVAEDGSWNEEGTIYTAYKTITGKTKSDGLNRIYIYGAEDNEHFPCPYEKTRFNIIVQAAGSLSTGFYADAGLGRVDLSWDNTETEIEDAMGINIYRYHQFYMPAGWRNGKWCNAGMVNDTVRLNHNILDIETVNYSDYDVKPGETYYYFYEVISSDMQTSALSSVVTATPLTSTRGDANGSGSVDVADVITTVNFITKQNPKPFIFEAADINTDNNIDILDVMGIVKGILNPSLLASSMAVATATYTIEDGTLYVESDVALGGVQVQLTMDGRSQMEDLRVAEDLDGFEQASAWLSDNDYLFLAYSLNGKALTPGKHALLYIGDSEISSLRLSDTTGKNINVSSGNGTTGIDRMGKHVMNVNGVYDLQGRKLSPLTSLKKGIYIINGKKVVK